MDHLLPVQLVELQSIATDLAENVIAPLAAEVDAECRWPAHSMRALAEAGLLGLQVPVDQGGLGQGLLGLCVLTEAIARACPSSALCYGMHCVATAVIAAKATDHQREHYLKEIAAGRHVTTLALSEQGTGAHFYLPETRLDADGEDFVVDGTKQFVTNGGHADSFVVSTVAAGAEAVGYPCFVKPVMSSSGKGQSFVEDPDQIADAWAYAQSGGRVDTSRVIVEGRIDFDFEITLLTVRHVGGTSFCAPIGHRQENGDYQESWQPQPMAPAALAEAKRIALAVTDALGGRGIFGVELFVKGEQVWFCEISPRPHDTGLVTLVSQDLSEFALHARAILGLPIPVIRQLGPAASAVVLVEGESTQVSFGNLAEVLAEPDTALRLFGKPGVSGQRRMGVALARDTSIDAARQKALRAAAAVKIEL